MDTNQQKQGSSISKSKERLADPQQNLKIESEVNIKNDEQITKAPEVEEKGKVEEQPETPMELTALEIFLSEHLKDLSISAKDGRLVYHKLEANDCDLEDVSFLWNLEHLQIIELTGNKLTELKLLGNCKYLTRIDVSVNQLTEESLKFDPPFNLQYFDISRNQIKSIKYIDSHLFLKHICLDCTKNITPLTSDNQIESLDGLEACTHLQNLSVRGNLITDISHLKNPSIKHLDLRTNKIKSIVPLNELKELLTVLLDENEIETLSGLEGHPFLTKISLSNNRLYSLFHFIDCLASLPILYDLNVSNNSLGPVRSKIIHHLPNLMILDNIPISGEEKVASFNKFEPSDYVVQACAHAKLTRNRIRNNPATIAFNDIMI